MNSIALDLLRQKLRKATVDKWLRNSKILKEEAEWEAGIIATKVAS